jgi:hypothetical protein
MLHSSFRSLIWLAALCGAAWLLPAACGDGNDSSDESGQADNDDDASPEGDDDNNDNDDDTVAPCPRGVTTAGIGLAWKLLNHRISFWEAYPSSAACPAERFDDVSLVAGYVGGDWSTGQIFTDAPHIDYRYFAVDSSEIAFLPLEVELRIDPPDYVAATVVDADLDAAKMAGRRAYAAFVNGLELWTDLPQPDPDYPADYDPALGYTSRGLGAGVEELTVEGDAAHLSVWARFELGPADRDAMNRAIPHAETGAVVHVLLVGVDDGAITPFNLGYLLQYDPPRPLFQPKYPHATEEMRRAEVAGEPGYPVAFVGWRSFDFRLFGSATDGDYIREISAQADLLSYDPASGQAVVDVDGYASNASTFLTYETMENDFAGELALVQLAFGDARAGQVSQWFETGEITLPLE